MNIIEIKKTAHGEVAYIYDNGRVLKLPVEDFTRNGYNDSEEQFEVTPPVRRRIPVVEETVDQEPPLVPAKPRVAPKSIIPQHLAGVFLPPDSPGAAVERRQI